MNKPFEKYNIEELKMALLNQQEREQIINYIYNDVFRMIYKYLHPKMRGRTKDYLQDSSILLLKHIESFKGGAGIPLQSFKSFWLTIAKRHVIRESKKEKRKLDVIPLSDYEKELIQDIDFDDKENRNRFFYKAFQKLGEDCQTIIDFVKLQEKSYEDLQKEVALLEKIGRQGAKADNLRDKLRQCRKKFVVFLGEYFDENGHLNPKL